MCSGKCSLTSDGISTFAVAMPASATADSARNTVPLSTNARPPSPTTTATRAAAAARWRPATRATVGAKPPKTANASTGNDVRSPASGPLRERPRRTSSSTGPTLTAAGRRLQERSKSPTTTRTVRRDTDTAGSCHPARCGVTSEQSGLSVGWGRMADVGELARHIGDDERRARLGVRNALARPVADPLAAARAVTCLHATEPASVHLAAWARSGASLADVDKAMYDDRTLVKQLAMRWTVFALPRELMTADGGSPSARVAYQQLRQVAKEVQDTGIAHDGLAWTKDHLQQLQRLLTDEGPLTAAQIRERLPTLD